MKDNSLIEELLAHARRLVGMSGPGNESAVAPQGLSASRPNVVQSHGYGASWGAEPQERIVEVGASPVRVRFFSEAGDGSAAGKAKSSHVEVLLPAINSRAPERVMLSKEHWALLAQLLLRQKTGAVVQPQQAEQPVSSALLRSEPDTLRSRSSIEASVAAGAGEKLYLLDCGKLYVWATDHWNSLTEMEAVCDAYRHNWRAWSEKYRHDWSVPERFFACHERLAKLQRRAARERGEGLAEAAPHAPSQNSNPCSSVQGGDECLSYAALLEDVLFSWDDRERLTAQAEKLRQNLRQGTPTLPSELSPRRILELIEMRLHALLSVVTVVREPKPASTQIEPRHGPPPGCPEWPAEAEHSAAVALAADKFFHATGLLGFMGYRVGKKSALTADRRRAILTYVFLGALPLVNDRHYMQEWGKPKSSRRLRKLANSLAAFARNARRKKTSSWQQAIANWEADLAYLKKRYFDRRKRDWKWPETVRRGRRQ